MAAENPPYAIGADSHSAEVFRRAISSLLGGVTGVADGGIVNATDLQVSAGSGNSINVAAGECWIPGNSEGTKMGAYYAYNDATVNLGITPSGSGIVFAIVVASVNDQAYTGNPSYTGAPADDSWGLAVIQQLGSYPATPTNSLLLAQVQVPISASSSSSYTITDKRALNQLTVGLGEAGNPSGSLFGASGTVSGTTVAPLGSATTQFLRGGVTKVTSGSSGLQVPVAGEYLVIAGASFALNAGVAGTVFVGENGGTTAFTDSVSNAAGGPVTLSARASGILSLGAGAIVNTILASTGTPAYSASDLSIALLSV